MIKKIFYIILYIFLCNNVLIAQDEIAMDASQSIVSFTEEQLSGFEKQAEQEIMDLTSQINIIAYKSNPLKKKMDAISTAMELFANEENI